MGDRKQYQKYYPPDFDPAKLPRNKGKYQVRSKKHLDKESGRDQITVRMALPFTLRCDTCGEFMGRGRKFNSRKEVVKNRTYHGIKIFRFYQRCTRCSSEFTFCTDPEHMDYAAEHGAARHFEPWKEEAEDREQQEAERAQEDADDALRALENRTAESRAEMAELEALDDLRGRSALHEAQRAAAAASGGTASGGSSAVGGRPTAEELQAAAEAADEAELQSVVFRSSAASGPATAAMRRVGGITTAMAAQSGGAANQPVRRRHAVDSTSNSGMLPSGRRRLDGGEALTATARAPVVGTSAHSRTLPKSAVQRMVSARVSRPPPKASVVVRARVVPSSSHQNRPTLLGDGSGDGGGGGGTQTQSATPKASLVDY